MTLSFKNKFLLLAFFVVLLTSFWEKNAYLLLSFSIMCYLFIPFWKCWDRISVYLVIFSILYVFILYMNGWTMMGPTMILLYLISPVVFYRFGRYLMELFQTDISRQKLLFFMIFCFLIVVFLFTLKDISQVGLINYSRLLLITSDSETNFVATIYGMMASLGIGCVGSVFKDKIIWKKYLWFFLILLSLLVVIHLLNRTGIVVFILCFLFCFLFFKKIKLSKIFSRVILLSLLFIALKILIMDQNILGQNIIDAYAERENVESASFSQLGGRMGRWIEAIENLFAYPFGWQGERYAHNLWLDIARISGILPFVFFLIATCLFIKYLIRLLRLNTSSGFAKILTSLNIAIFLNSFVEPVIEASCLYFLFSMMIWGMTKTIVMEEYKDI